MFLASTAQPGRRLILPLLLATLVVGCSDPDVEALMPTPILFPELGIGPLDHVPEDQRWKPRRVYFATTRARVGDLQRIGYSNKESDAMSVGMALIGFGGPEISWADLNRFSREATRGADVDLTIAGLVEAGQVGLDQVSATGGAAAWLLADLNASIAAARDNDLLIYVHGAKVNFYNACAFAAQLDHFMGRDMTSLAFSWPTRQNIFAYGSGSDVRRAYRHADALGALIELLADQSTARRIHVVAWSAGGRLVTEALSRLHARLSGSNGSLRDKLRIGTVYLAAADVPGDEFLDALPAINDLVQRVVVTASSGDGALLASETFLGGDLRIGRVRESVSAQQDAVLRAADRLEVIDVSRGAEQRGFDIAGHRYWFDHPWASSDLVLAVRSDLAPPDRALEPGAHPVLWLLPGDYPERLASVLRRPGLVIRQPP